MQQFRRSIPALLLLIHLVCLAAEAAAKALPPTWHSLVNSVNKEELELAAKVSSLTFEQACTEWGKGVRAGDASNRQQAIGLRLRDSGSLNEIDRVNVPLRGLQRGMTQCGVFASVGKPRRVTSKCKAKPDNRVMAKILPVLNAAKATIRNTDRCRLKREHCTLGDPWMNGSFGTEFSKALSGNGPVSVEARVALLDYYFGEYLGGLLGCTVIADGDAALKALNQYMQCDHSVEAFATLKVRSISSYESLIHEIKYGTVKQKCF